MTDNFFGKPSFRSLPAQSRHRGVSLRGRLLASVGLLMVQDGTTRQPQRGAGSRRLRRAGIVGACALSSLLAGAAHANPTGGVVVAGQASIQAVTPNTLDITQSSDRAILNWQSFSIGAGETVRFHQPSASSVTLNRVVGNDPSAIFGSLTANGTVMLVNPNGVIFGAGSRIDVGGLVATTVDISDANFMGGKYIFDKPSGIAGAAVINEGDITIGDSGLAALVAPHVRNSGVIQARLGRVALASAERFTLDFHGDGLLSFDAGSAVQSAPRDADGNPVGALVVNSGAISADGGTVALTARAVKGVIDTVINTDGVIKATSVGSKDGKIVLSGGSSGTVAISGVVDASGLGAGETGGSIVATGANVAVGAGAVVTADGRTGGGSIAIGSATGKRDGSRSEQASVAAGASVSADATGTGKGGTVTVLSTDRTAHEGAITARGGATGGDGGFVEVSSDQDIILSGSIDLSAANGKTGLFLLDPESLRIVAAGGGSQNTAASDGTLASSDANQGTGTNVNTLSRSVLEAINSNANIELEATGLISVETSLNLQTGTGNSFTLRSTGAGGRITFTDLAHEIRTNGGAIRLEALGTGGSLTNIGKLTSTNGDISLLASGTISVGGAIAAGAGTITLDSAASSILRAGAGAALSGAVVNLSALGGSIGAPGAALATTTGDLRLASGGSIVVTNSSALTNLVLTANHADSAAASNTYSVSATGLTFQMTDGASAVTLGSIASNGTTLSVSTDRGLLVNTVNTGTAAVSLTANGGSITGTGGSARITGGALTLVARDPNGSDGGIGTSDAALNTTVHTLTVTSGSGALNIANTGAVTLANIDSASTTASSLTATGTITVGAVSVVRTSGSSSLTIATTGGSIVDDGNAATGIKANTLSLTASGAIGASGGQIVGSNATSVAASAGAGGVYVSTNTASTSTTTFQSVQAAGGNIVLSTLGHAVLTSVDGSGDISVTSGGGITYNDVKAGTTGDITLSAGGSGIATTGSGVVGFRGRKLTATGTTTMASLSLVSAMSEINATAGASGNISVTQTGSVLLNNLVTTTGQITVAVTGTGAVTTAKTLTTNSTINITTPGALVAAAGNSLSAWGITLNAGGAIASSGSRLNTRTTSLTLTNTGSYYIDNTAKLLTALTIDNKHVGSVANTLSLTSQGLNFTLGDDGTKTTLSEVSSPFLTTFSMTSDKTLVLGQLSLANVTAAAITTTDGSILDDGNALTNVSAKKITFTATENIGAAGQAIGLNTTDFKVTTRGDLHVANQAHFNYLDITSTHATTDAVNTFTVTGQHLDLAITDHAVDGYTVARLIDTGYDAGGGLKAVSFTGDRDITLGQINTGLFDYEQPDPYGPYTNTVSNNVRFVTSAGSILDDGIDTTTVLASNIILGSTRSVGRAEAHADIDLIAKGLVVTTGTETGLDRADGGIHINALRTGGISNESNRLNIGSVNSNQDSGFQTQTGDVVIKLAHGDVTFGSGSTVGTSLGTMTVEATTGSIISAGTTTLVSGPLGMTLTAGKAIGGTGSNEAIRISAAEITATATQGGVTLSSVGGDSSTGALFSTVTAGGDISITQSNRHLRVGAINANGGTGKIALVSTTYGQSIYDDGNSATSIVGGDVTLGVGSAGTISGGITTTTPILRVTGSSTIGVVNSQALTDLTVSRSGSSGSVSITGTGQSLSMSGAAISTLTSTTGLDFALTVTDGSTLSVGAVNVGAAGTFSASTGGAINWTGGSGGRIVADTVSLTAGSSYAIGTSSAPVRVTSGKLVLNAGMSMYVASDVALTHLDVTSTNAASTTATPPTYSITNDGGPNIAISDNGTKHTIDVSGGASPTDFSFTGRKDIAVSEIITTGAVKLTTSGGGTYSNITSISPYGRIFAASVTLAATGTGTGNGSIGSSTNHFQVTAPSVDVTGNGDIRVNNATTVTALKVTSTHKSSATTDINTYSFTGLGTGRSFTVSEAAGVQTVTMSSGAGTMAFAYSVDRALLLGTLDAGTSSTGSITLTSTAGATGVAPTINRGSGSITAGEVTLRAVGSNGNVGGNATLSTNTQKLSVASGGNISISNSSTLTHLNVEALHKKSPSGANTYAISSTGLTFSISDTLSGSSVTAVNLGSVSQSGLNLTLKTDKKINLSSVNVGAGTVTLVSTNNIESTSGSSVVTAGTLDLTGQSISRSSGGNPLIGTVGTLKISATGSINYQNQGSLALAGVSNLGDSDSYRATAIKVLSGNLTQVGTDALATNQLTLTVDAGSIGTGGAPLLIDAQDVTLSTGRHVYLTNQSDFYKLGWTVTHSSVGVGNTYAITAENLTTVIADDGTALTLTTFDDASGLDFTFSTDTHLSLSTVSATLGRTMDLTTTGTAKNISSVVGLSSVTAGKLTLTASGNITTNFGNRLKVNAHALNIVTGGDVILDNLLDMQTLSITSEKATGGAAPTFSLTGQNLTFSIVDSGTALINVTDTTGLAFTFDTVRGQSLGVIDLTAAGAATLTSDNSILGSATPTDRLTAAVVTLNGRALGSSTDILRLDAPGMTLSSQGNIYVDSALHIEKLKLTNSSASSTADRTFSIIGADLAGQPGAATIHATHTNAGGTVFTSITDTTGLDFEFVNDRITQLGSVNVGAAGLLTVTSGPGIREIDADSSITAGKIVLTSTSGAVGQTAGDGGGLLDITAAQLKVAANNGAHIDLKTKTKVSGFSVAGSSTLTVSSGDLEIGGSGDTDGGMSLNGAALVITVTDGSILGGNISGAGTLTLNASGAIGTASAPLYLSANSSGTTTLTATAGNGGIYLTEGYGLTINTLSATSDVVIGVGSSSAARTLTLNGDLNAGTGTVSLTVQGTGSVVSTTAGGKITGSSVTLTAAGGSIGAGSNATTVVKTDTAKLTLNSGSNIHINNGTTDLTDLTINRATKDAGTSTNGTLAVAAQNLTFTVTDNGTVSTLTNVTDTTGLNFSYKAKGNIAVGTISVGAGSVDLQATANTQTSDVTSSTTRSITGSTDSNKITAGALTLVAGSNSSSAIGSTSRSIGTNVQTLTLTSGGAAYVHNDGALTLDGAAAGGALTVATTAGALTLNGPITWSSTGALTLDAGGSLLSNGIVLAPTGPTATITLRADTGIGTASNAFRITPTSSGLLGTTVAASVTGAGSLYLDLGASLIGGLTTSVADGATVVNSAGSIVVLGATSATDAVGNDITIKTTSGNITLGSTGAAGLISAGQTAGRVALQAAGGIRTAHADSTVSAHEVTLRAADSIGTSTAGTAIDVSSDRLLASTATAGQGVYLTAGDALGVSGISTRGGAIIITGADTALLLHNLVSGAGDAATGGAISVTTTGAGSIIAGGITAAGTASRGNVALDAGTGTISDDGQSATRVVAGTLSLAAGTGIGTQTNALGTDANTITGGTSGVGAVHIADGNSAGVTLGTSGTALATSNGALAVTAAGPITVTNVIGTTDAVGNTVTITTTSGDITIAKLYAGTTSGTGTPTQSSAAVTAAGSILASGIGDHIVAGAVSLTSTTGTIGTVTDLLTGAGTPIKVKTATITGLTATAANTVVSVENSATTALALANGALSLGTGTSAYIKTGGDLDLTQGLTMSSGNLSLDSGGTLKLPVAAINIGGGALTLKGATDIVTGTSGRTLQVTAGSLVLRSGSAGGDTSLTSSVGSISATLTGTDKNLTITNTGALTAATLVTNGNITATNNGAFTADTVTASGANRAVNLTASTGDLTLGTINAGSTGALTLTASGGRLLAAPGGTTLTGNSLSITTASGVGTATEVFQTNFTRISATVTGTGGIYLAGTTFDLGNLSTANGDIEVTATGAITDASMTQNISANGNVTLVSTGGPVTLSRGYTNQGGDASRAGFTVQGTSISLAAVTTSGAQNYTGATTTTGNLAGGTGVNVTGSLTLGGTGTTRSITSTTGPVTVTGTLAGGAKNVTVAAGTGQATFGGAITGVNALSVTAATISTQGATSSGAQTFTGATTLGGTYASGNGAITVTGATLLADAVTITAGTGAITFGSTINGTHALILHNTGQTTIGGAVGGTTALASLTATTGGTTSLKSVTTIGTQTYDNAVSLSGTYTTSNAAVNFAESASLAGAVTVNAGSGNVTFANTVDGARALTINSTGATVFNAAVGGVTALAALTTDAGGSVNLRDVTTTGAQTYGEAATLRGTYSTGGGAFSVGGPIILAADTTLDALDGGVTLGGPIDGAYGLIVNSTGAIDFQDVVGGVTALTSLSVGTGGTLNLHSVTTTGTQTYGSIATLNSTFTTTNAAITFGDAVILNHDAVVSTGSGAVTFAGTVNGAQGLTVNSTGATAFEGAVGGTTALASLTTNAGGTLRLNSVKTIGAQTYGEAATIAGTFGTTNAAVSFGGPVVLGGSTTINAGTGAVTVAGTLDGGHRLSLTGGQVTFADTIGAIDRLGALTVNGSGATLFGAAVRAASVTTDAAGTLALNGASIHTTGAQSYGERMTLASDTTLTGTLVTLAGGVQSATAGTSGLIVTGNAAFGNGAAVRDLSVTGTTVLAGTVTTSGAQSYAGAATLTGTSVLSSGAEVAFLSPLNGGHGLTIEAGQVTFANAIGATDRLGSLTVNTAGQTLFGGTVRAASVTTDAPGTLALNGGSVDTTGAQSYGERAVLGANTTLTGSLVTLQGGVDAATTGSQSLAIIGNAAFNDAVGGTAALSGLSVTGTSAIGQDVSTTGTQTFGGTATLSGDIAFVSTAGSLVFGGSIDTPDNTALSLTAGDSISVAGTTGAGTPAGSLIIRAGNAVTFTGNVAAESVHQEAATGLTSFLDGITASGASGVHLTGGSYVFNGPVSAIEGAFILNNAATATVAFSADAAIQAGTGFIQSGGASILLPSSIEVTLGPITLAAPATLHAGNASIVTAGDITMTGLVGAATNLTMDAGSKGELIVGLSNGNDWEKIEVRSLTVPSAKSATLYGRVAGNDGSMAATVINSVLRGAPYFINGTPWGPMNVYIPNPPPVPVPSTPSANSLFTGTINSSGITPNALQAFVAPQVLIPSASPAPLVPSSNAGPSFAPGQAPAPSGTGTGTGNQTLPGDEAEREQAI